MTIYPSSRQVGEPYTEESIVGINLDKKNWFRCLECNYAIETGLPNPKCGICHNILIRIVKSHFNDELA